MTAHGQFSENGMFLVLQMHRSHSMPFYVEYTDECKVLPNGHHHATTTTPINMTQKTTPVKAKMPQIMHSNMSFGLEYVFFGLNDASCRCIILDLRYVFFKFNSISFIC